MGISVAAAFLRAPLGGYRLGHHLPPFREFYRCLLHLILILFIPFDTFDFTDFLMGIHGHHSIWALPTTSVATYR